MTVHRLAAARGHVACVGGLRHGGAGSFTDDACTLGDDDVRDDRPGDDRPLPRRRQAHARAQRRRLQGREGPRGLAIGDRYRRGSIVGDSTTVTIDWANGYPTESYDVQRLDGTWLVVFDSAA